jgi:hypothetical protein
MGILFRNLPLFEFVYSLWDKEIYLKQQQNTAQLEQFKYPTARNRGKTETPSTQIHVTSHWEICNDCLFLNIDLFILSY